MLCSVTLTKEQQFRKTYLVYMRPVIRDKLTPIEAEVRYSLPEHSEREFRRRFKRLLPPVLGSETPTKSDVIIIQKNCGPDNICIPDMQLQAKS